MNFTYMCHTIEALLSFNMSLISGTLYIKKLYHLHVACHFVFFTGFDIVMNLMIYSRDSSFVASRSW